MHKVHSKDPKNENILLYNKFNETDINDWYIELYEDCPCERREQVTQREGQVIREIGTLNKNIAGRTCKEWREENKDKINEKHKEYDKKNKDKKKEYNETNKDRIKEKMKEYRENNKEKMKEYQENNKDKMKEKMKEYRENHKEHKSERVLCECGCTVRRDYFSIHNQSLKHQELMKTISIYKKRKYI
jgi:hypothetical protein